MNAMVTILAEEYAELLEAQRMLECLHANGVDNWSGYSDAMDMFYEAEEDDD